MLLDSTAEYSSSYLFTQYLAKPELKLSIENSNYESIDSLEKIHSLYSNYYLKIDNNVAKFESLKDEFNYKIQVSQQALRKLRNHVLCSLIERQQRNLCNYQETVITMSYLADFAINTLVELNQNQLNCIYNYPIDEHGNPIPIIIMAMGKLGGYELNVSSDIDLVFLFDDNYDANNISEKNTKDSKKLHISTSEYFEKLGQRIIQGLNKITEHGFVFRVDMRLRPYGDIGSIVCNVSMFEEYLLTQGRAWERFAWLKARQVYPANQNKYLAQLIRTFVYRRYLDYNLLEALREVHQKIGIEQNKKANQLSIKLGNGGIREIEFISQVYQLIHGGQNPHLQVNNTINALEILPKYNLISHKDSQELIRIYVEYRNLEHAIQYLRDEHTHNLPKNDNQKDWTNITILLNKSNIENIKLEITHNQEYVHNLFQKIFYEPEKPKQQHFDFENLQLDGGLNKWLNDNHFSLPEQILAHINSMLGGAKYRLLSSKAQQYFKNCIYFGIISCAKAENRDIVLMRYIDFLNIISPRRSYLSLLVQYPAIINKLVTVLGHSSWISQYVITHPQVIDELLRSVDKIEFDWQEYRTRLAHKLDLHKNSLEHQLDTLRQHYHAEVFRILLAEIYGQYDVLKIADLLSALVDATLEETIQAVWNTIEINEPVPHFAVIAYGKLGGKELGYESDLDLVFLYDEESSKLPDASTTYTYLARKLITWLTSNTGAGKVCEIDTRLRPNGQSGMLVSSIQGFIAYQTQRVSNSAWTWEHQALTRARFCAGNAKIGGMFEKLRCDILSAEKDKNKLKQEIIAMRSKISQEKKYQTELFNLKYSVGGMIDIEFVVQYLILAYGKEYDDLLNNLGNVKLLEIASNHGLIAKDVANNAANAYKYYRRMQYKLRLDQKKSIINADEVQNFILDIKQLWQHVLG
ncbi:MAG: hypothetical protein RLZZ210_1577 [Pseudomonadota bacterium]